MAFRTKINAESGKQEITITREFDLPVAMLFRAYTDPELLEQWMGTRVLKLENKQHGGYRMETSDQDGNVVFRANGVIHEFVQDQKITRTFEMEGASFGVQLEFLDFSKVTEDASKLNIQSVFRSVELRDQLLQLPFAQGLNMAHDRLQEIAGKLT